MSSRVAAAATPSRLRCAGPSRRMRSRYLWYQEPLFFASSSSAGPVPPSGSSVYILILCGLGSAFRLHRSRSQLRFQQLCLSAGKRWAGLSFGMRKSRMGVITILESRSTGDRTSSSLGNTTSTSDGGPDPDPPREARDGVSLPSTRRFRAGLWSEVGVALGVAFCVCPANIKAERLACDAGVLRVVMKLELLSSPLLCGLDVGMSISTRWRSWSTERLRLRSVTHSWEISLRTRQEASREVCAENSRHAGSLVSFVHASTRFLQTWNAHDGGAHTDVRSRERMLRPLRRRQSLQRRGGDRFRWLETERTVLPANTDAFRKWKSWYLGGTIL
eukprot:scaffold8602_cov277-Pinguiococcus_pyrenoidosus.AAC.7